MFTSLIVAAAISGSPMFVERITPSEERAVAVRMTDLDLGRQDDRARLRIRLQSAISRACPPSDYNGVRDHMPLAQCRRTAELSARRALAEAVASYERRQNTLSAPDELAEITLRKQSYGGEPSD